LECPFIFASSQPLAEIADLVQVDRNMSDTVGQISQHRQANRRVFGHEFQELSAVER